MSTKMTDKGLGERAGGFPGLPATGEAARRRTTEARDALLRQSPGIGPYNQTF
ncbi:hypothetical protein QBK99_15120 [Corticibacterium sp. UT-5YL-CI-8]|nr:hypothetical protein [Tianweitania sp. UT-5YL-CI-8]